jgi:hypothetical protein
VHFSLVRMKNSSCARVRTREEGEGRSRKWKRKMMWVENVRKMILAKGCTTQMYGPKCDRKLYFHQPSHSFCFPIL